MTRKLCARIWHRFILFDLPSCGKVFEIQSRRPMTKAIIFDLDSCLAAADEVGEPLFAPAFAAIRAANNGSVPEVRACLKTTRSAVVGQKAGWRGAMKENIPCGSSTEEQQSRAAFCPSTLRAAGLLAVDCVGSVLTAHCGDAPASPPCPRPKSLAAAPRVVFKQALRLRAAFGLETDGHLL